MIDQFTRLIGMQPTTEARRGEAGDVKGRTRIP
jgi:hypothetical protein